MLRRVPVEWGLLSFRWCLAREARLAYPVAPCRACSSRPHPMTQIVASTHVLAVKDLDASRRFYTESLGFQEDLQVDGWSFLSRGACKLRIGHCPDAVSMAQCQDHSWFAYLHVSDVASLYRELVQAKVEIWLALADRPWGFREFAIVTQDGHRIVFGQNLAA